MIDTSWEKGVCGSSLAVEGVRDGPKRIAEHALFDHLINREVSFGIPQVGQPERLPFKLTLFGHPLAAVALRATDSGGYPLGCGQYLRQNEHSPQQAAGYLDYPNNLS
jgi:hypothetical protein